MATGDGQNEKFSQDLFCCFISNVARDLPGGKQILIIKMRAQHITFSKAIRVISVRF